MKKNKKDNSMINAGKAISDPTRLAVMLLLNKHKKLTVGAMIEILGIEATRFSHHLKKLRKCGAVEGVRKGKTVEYCIAKAAKRRNGFEVNDVQVVFK